MSSEVGWDRMEAGWWTDVAAALPRPWPKAAAAFDLRWWAGQRRATAGKLNQVAMPSVRELAKRWGWGRPRVDELLAAAWVDPFFLARDGAGSQPQNEAPKTEGDGATTGPVTEPRQGHSQSHDRASAEATNAEKIENSSHDRASDGATTEPVTEPRQSQSVPCSPSINPGARHGSPSPDTITSGERESAAPSVAPSPLAPVMPPAVVRSRALPALPPWCRAANPPQRLPGEVVLATVVRCAEEILQRTVSPDACKAAGEKILALWRATGWQEPEAFVAAVGLVARACRECGQPAFRNDVRGLDREGEQWRDDHSRDPPTVCRVGPPKNSSGASWDMRLDLAQQWAAAGFPPDTLPQRPAIRGAYTPAKPPKPNLKKEQDDAFAKLEARLAAAK